MKNKILIHICLLTMILVTSSCTPVVDTPTHAPITLNTPTPTTVLYTASPQPTQTDLPPALTNTPPATPVLQPVIDVTVKYVNSQFELPGLSGKLAISIRGLSHLAYLHDLTKNEQIILGDPDWDYSLINSVSPDREKIVLQDSKYQNYLVDSNGNITNRINQISPTSGIDGWLDNDRLIIFDAWDNGISGLPRLTIWMNIHTDQIVTLEPIYPNIGDFLYSWGISGLTIYHPQLPIVVFPALTNVLSSIVIYDTEKQQELAEFPAIIVETHTPKWSPDGNYLLLAGVLNSIDPGKDEEVYILDTGGRVVFKTLFRNHSPKEEFKGFSWSPNSQKIAFWINDYYGPIYQLAILDVNSGIVTQYDLFTHGGNSGGPPIWSPDSQYVAVQQAMDFDLTFVTTTLLHLDTGNAFDFSSDPDLRIAGWVK
jgi:hypothetical protein